MRWDRLFADLEGQAEDLELEERDALVNELRDGEWAETSWRDLAGGHVVLEVAGLGRVEGEARLVNDHVLHLAMERVEHMIASSAVLEVVSSEQRAVAPTTVTSRLGWGHLFRAAKDDGGRTRITRTDGQIVDGTVDVVGRDFVRFETTTGRRRTVPFVAVAALTVSSS